MSEMFVQSLGNRVRAMNTLYERAVSDMTLDQVNHHEREAYCQSPSVSATSSAPRTSPSAARSSAGPRSGTARAGPGRSASRSTASVVRRRWKRCNTSASETSTRGGPFRPRSSTRTAGVLETLSEETAVPGLAAAATTEHAANILRDGHRTGRAPAQARSPGVLRLPARPPPHGRDRARAGAGGAWRDDELATDSARGQDF